MIIEDGTLVAGSDSYVDSIEFTEFLTVRNLTVSDGTEASLLYKAMDIIEQQIFKGTKIDATQSLSFPRKNITDREGNAYDDNTIPSHLKKAVMWLAYYLDSNPDFTSIVAPEIKKKTIDIITTEYAVGESGYVKKKTLKDLPNVYAELKHLMQSSSGRLSVIRG